MATDLQVPYVSLALTADGGANGRLTVTSTTGLRKGAFVMLASSTQASVQLVIDTIESATTVTVRDPTVTGAFLFNCSSYLVADSAVVVQNPQVDFYASQWLRF